MKRIAVDEDVHGPGRSADGLASAIRHQILSGEFQPGDALREVSLSERFGVSRRTVREALLKLSAERLVTHRHNQGASVRIFSAEDVEDLYRSRRLLEVEAARCAASLSEEELAAVDVAFGTLKTAADNGLTSIELAQADTAFHGSIIALLGSPLLNDFYASIAQQMVRVIMLLQHTDASEDRDLKAVIAEHQAINDAIQHRDVWEARRLLVDHIERHQKNLIAGLA